MMLPEDFNPAQCDLRHDRIDETLLELRKIIHGNGRAGLREDVTLLKERLASVQHELTTGVSPRLTRVEQSVWKASGAVAVLVLLVTVVPKIISIL